MSAIITSKFRKENAAKVLAEILADSAKYYLGVGKADKWPGEGTVNEAITAPSTDAKASLEAKGNLLALKKIDTTGSARMIPKVELKAGRKYKAYDSNDETVFYPTLAGDTTTEYPCFAVYNGGVYLCIRNGTESGAAWATSSSTLTDESGGYFSSTGGYDWVFIYDLIVGSVLDIEEFVEVEEAAGTAVAQGEIWHAVVVNGGTGNSVDGNAVTVQGDGTGFAATYVESGGIVTGITITNVGANYTQAKLDLSALTDVEINLSITPSEGFGVSALNDLPSWYLGVAVQYTNAEGGEISTKTEYRQISLIKDPTITPGDGAINSPEDDITADALRYITVDATLYTGLVAQLSVDITSGSYPVIRDTATNAVGYAIRAEDLGGNIAKIYYYQNYTDSVTLIPFTNGAGTVDVHTDGDVDGTPNSGLVAFADDAGEYDGTSGELIFLENRDVITRAPSQIEDIRLIIQY